MNNKRFLEVIKKSFITSLETHPRSTAKLKVLHGFIANDLQKKLGSDYVVKSYGINNGKEARISGRYMNKSVDITIQKNNQAVAGFAVKFVMSNYHQNSNNYFENMLGETANIRSKNIPYFQIFILPGKVPYYTSDRKITRWELISSNNVEKYIKLSEDDNKMFFHTPTRTLFILLDYGEFIGAKPSTKKEYINYFLTNKFEVKYSSKKIKYSSGVIYNDYDTFITKTCHYILSI